jgi:hypothetical protein
LTTSPTRPPPSLHTAMLPHGEIGRRGVERTTRSGYAVAQLTGRCAASHSAGCRTERYPTLS